MYPYKLYLAILLLTVILSTFTVLGCQQSKGTATSVEKISDQKTEEGSEGTGVLEPGENKDYKDPFPKDPEKYKAMPLPNPTKRLPKKIAGDPETPVSQPAEKDEEE